MTFAEEIIVFIEEYDVDDDPGDLVESILEMAYRKTRET